MTTNEQREPTSNNPAVWIVRLGLHAALWAAVCWLLISRVPAGKGMFEDFGVELPTSVILLIHLSDLFAKFWYILLPLLMGSLLGLDVLIGSAWKSAPARVLTTIVLVIVPFGAVLAGAALLQATVIRLMDQLS